MRTHWTIAITQLACVGGGALLTYGFTAESSNITTGCLIGGTLLALASVGWLQLKLAPAIGWLSQTAIAPEKAGFAPAGVDEIAQIGQRFIATTEKMSASAVSVNRELQEIRSFLEKVDRRQTQAEEVDRAGGTLQRLKDVFGGLTRTLNEDVKQVVTCGREIERNTEELVGGTEQQSQAITRTTALVEKMASQIENVYQNAKAAVGSSAIVLEHSNQGLNRFGDLVDQMKKVRNHSAVRERKLSALEQHTREVGSIVETIGTISSRTDMLALNASIESVRAGEHGRGFAVVAEEVRALAEQSAQAVLDITARIESIQLETRKTVSGAADEHRQLDEVIELAADTLHALQEINGAAAESSRSSGDISGATEQQLLLTQELVTSLGNNSQVSKGNRGVAEGILWTAKTFTSVGGRLTESVGALRGQTQTFEHGQEPVTQTNDAPFPTAMTGSITPGSMANV